VASEWIWYAAAIILPLLTHAVAIGLNVAAGAPAPSMAQFHPWYAVLMVFGLSMVNPVEGPLGEEPAWRGFAQPRLQSKWSPLASAALLALLITTWHLPLALHAAIRPRGAGHCVDRTGHLLYSWLFNRSGGSALLTLIAHVTEGSVRTGALWPLNRC
jgi:membrane protease YdiL (CAAX protease family)